MRSIAFLLPLLLLSACGAASQYPNSTAAAPVIPPPPTYPTYPPAGGMGATGGAQLQFQSAETVAISSSKDNAALEAVEYAVSGLAGGAATGGNTGSSANTGSSPPAPPLPSAVEPQANVQEMFDIEARVSIEVEKVHEAAAKLRDIARKHGCQIVADAVTHNANAAGASFTLRVASKGSDAFLDAVSAIGDVRSRQVTARDIGKEYHDAAIYLSNLELTLKRYEELLAKAQDVKAMLDIEREMTRIRAEIDRVKGDLRWMKDRAARATIYVTLAANRTDTAPTFNPKAAVYPGFRFEHLADFRGDVGNAGYLGLGLSIATGRWFSIDVDGFRQIGLGGSGLDLFTITAGGEAYSDFLGAGQRTWLNPYVGLRAGYARMLGKNELIAGGTVGIEIFKTKFVRADVETRVLGLFANPDVGGHLGLQSALGVHVAF